MNLETVRLIAKTVKATTIYRESALFHHRGINTTIDRPDDVSADDWKIRNFPQHMQVDSDVVRGFYILSESRYADACRVPGIADDIHIGFYGKDGSSETVGEFCIEWVTLGGKDIPRLKVFDGSWNVLRSFADLLEVMAIIDDANLSPKEFCKILIGLGLKDLTKREVRMQPSR